MSAIELADMTDACEEADVGDAIEGGYSASTKLNDTIEANKEQISEDDLNNLNDYINSGGKVGTINNNALKSAADNVIDSGKQTLAKLSKAFQTFNPKANFTELTFDDNLDPNKVGQETADANKDVLTREEAGIRKEIPDPADAAKKFEKAETEESDATKRTRYKMYTRLMTILAVGGTVGTLIYALARIADDMTGCYEVEVGKGQSMLKCNNKTKLRTNCICDDTLNPKTASKLLSDTTNGNGCIIDSTHTCPTYQYTYEVYHWWDLAAIIANTLQSDYDKGAGGAGAAGRWFASHWWVVLILIAVPMILLIILRSIKKT
jgi:hypothetical protein